jgi:hypothetical protein
MNSSGDCSGGESRQQLHRRKEENAREWVATFLTARSNPHTQRTRGRGCNGLHPNQRRKMIITRKGKAEMRIKIKIIYIHLPLAG